MRKKEPRVSNACPSSLHVFYVCVCLSAFVQRLLSGRPIELSEMIARHAYFIFGATTAAEARIVREEVSESESEIEDDMIEEDDEDMSEERTDQDKRTISSGSSKRDDDVALHPSSSYRRKTQYRR